MTVIIIIISIIIIVYMHMRNTVIMQPYKVCNYRWQSGTTVAT